MNNQELKIAELRKKLQYLVDETYKVLEATDNQDLKENLKKELNILKNRTDLKVSFVGQYSSGKSTIISALTGNKDIKIDANVATDVVFEYSWNNIVLLDTPGIMAGKVEQHDHRTKEALKNSDLVVYVLTSQLFDDVIFENFIDLAYTQHLKDKMLIVLNKMSMESGDFNTLVSNYTESMKGIFKERGYDFDFNTVFIDAADYIDGKEEEDQELIDLSNFNSFICALNQFVEEKGIIKKQFDTPVRLLKSTIADISLTQVDPNLQIILEQYKRQILKSKKDIEQAVKLELARFEQEIIEEGNDLGNSLGYVDEQEFKGKENAYDEVVKEGIKKTANNIAVLIEQEEQELLKKIEILDKKEAIVAYRKQIEAKLNSQTISVQQRNSYEKQINFLNMFKRGSDFLVKNSLSQAGQTGFKTMTSMASGTTIKNVVYNVGKFFGHNFKPWGATKIAANIGKWAKVGGAILSVAAVGLEFWNTYKEEKNIKELQNAKNQLFNSIRKYAADLTGGLSDEFLSYIRNSYDGKIYEMDSQIMEIVEIEKTNSKFSEMINKLSSEYGEYIDFIEVPES